MTVSKHISAIRLKYYVFVALKEFNQNAFKLSLSYQNGMKKREKRHKFEIILIVPGVIYYDGGVCLNWEHGELPCFFAWPSAFMPLILSCGDTTRSIRSHFSHAELY